MYITFTKNSDLQYNVFKGGSHWQSPNQDFQVWGRVVPIYVKSLIHYRSSSSSDSLRAKRPAAEVDWVSAAGWAHFSVELEVGRTSLCTANPIQLGAHSSPNRAPVHRLPEERGDHVATNKRSPWKTFYLPLLSLKHLLHAANLNSTQTCLDLCHVPQSVCLVKSGP